MIDELIFIIFLTERILSMECFEQAALNIQICVGLVHNIMIHVTFWG